MTIANTKTMTFHSGIFTTCRGYGSMTHNQENREFLLRQGYTIATGGKEGETRYYFFDEQCAKCRRMTAGIRELLRTKEGSA